MRRILHATIIATACLGITACKTAPKPVPAEATAAVASEHKTVEFDNSSTEKLRQQMAEWQREGWKVLSISKRALQPDGTYRATAELAR